MEQKKLETRPWDASEHLETEEDMAAYLDAALEDGDAALVVAALGDIARAKGMSQIAREAGFGARKSLQGAFNDWQPGVCHDSQGGAGARFTIPCASRAHIVILSPVSK